MVFIKNKENFICDKCGINVIGDGFTNHCPSCLWSKHVDISPGDRNSDCGGMMEPVGVIKKGREYSIIHKCQKCGSEKINMTQREDDFHMIIQISSNNLS